MQGPLNGETIFVLLFCTALGIYGVWDGVKSIKTKAYDDARYINWIRADIYQWKVRGPLAVIIGIIELFLGLYFIYIVISFFTLPHTVNIFRSRWRCDNPILKIENNDPKSMKWVCPK